MNECEAPFPNPRSHEVEAPDPAKAARARKRRKSPDLQAQVFRVFADQADSLWRGFTDQCRQFADGFNAHLGDTAAES